MSESWHGTLGGYTNHKCRCELCRKANTDYQYNKRLERYLDYDDERHGTANGYSNYSCRCRPCTDAHNAEIRRIRRRSRVGIVSTPDSD